MEKLAHDPRKLSQIYFSLAKRWWGASLTCTLATIIAGAAGSWVRTASSVTPVIVFVLGLMGQLLYMRSDADRGVAESLLRKLDFRDSFGWAISGAEMADVLAVTPDRIKARIPPDDQPDPSSATASERSKREPYFASGEECGPTRALRNLQESAWWSRHLARKACWYVSSLLAGVVVLAMILLLLSIRLAGSLDTLSTIGGIITLFVMLLVYLNALRIAMGHFTFSQKAERAERDACLLLKGTSTESEAVKLWAEYQLYRAAAPLIPYRVYKRSQKALNELWAQYRAKEC